MAHTDVGTGTDLATYRLLIGGHLVEASQGRRFEDRNPANGDLIAEVADASREDMDRAIEAARKAFDEGEWARRPAFRKECLLQLHSAMERHKEALRHIVVSEAGSPVLLTSTSQLQTPIDDFLYDVEMIDGFGWERSVPGRSDGAPDRVVVREPFGVVGAITPWNFPLALNLWKIGPALASGNTVVLKAAPDTPLSALALGRLVSEETDIPPGVFNVITASDPAATGEVLSADPRVDMVSFTGSVAVGKRILALASATVKKVVLELGGKSANIVCEDADLGSVMANIALMSCYHAGQGCALPMRTMVPNVIYQDAVDELAKALQNVAWGDPKDPANLMGPLISAKQLNRVTGYIERGQSQGARLVCGGQRSLNHPEGFYVEPTLFADVAPGTAIAEEEIFGPVQSVIPVADVDEAIALSNNTRYGLSGAVYSSSDDRALSIARQIRSGAITVNGAMGGGPDVPFGGYRESGLGREHGPEGFGEFLETKTIGLPRR